MRRTATIRSKIKGMTARELAGEASHRARRRISRAISRATNSPQTSYVSDHELRRSLGNKSIADVASRIRSSPRPSVVPGLSDLNTSVATVKQLFPESTERSRVEAEAILDHNIALFGRAADFGKKLDWHRDPRSSVRWPLVHYTRVPLVLGNGADVRVVWELNRLHHLVTLGRAYLLTGDERYAEEFLLQLASWYEDNPPNFGVNWTVAMEAGIRAVNIAVALEMFRGSPSVTDQAIELILKMLLAHARFIRANLELSYRTPSNHYLSDLIGLFVIGMTLPELRESRGWVGFGKRRLLKEMDRQVLSDGVDYEGAVGYHRFVLEIFALLFSNGKMDSRIAIPVRYWERLEAMFDFVRHYLKPDGTAPMIGDSDDGRLIKFTSRAAEDHSYLMSIAAVLFESDTFKQSHDIDEEAFWWFGQNAAEARDALEVGERAGSAALPEAQIFIQRALTPEGAPMQAIIDCGDHGARGRGSHAHSDALSIEVFAFDRTFIRDPGTYVYTASEQERNLFRSTAYHNTVRIDGEEISQVNEGELFAFASNVRPRVNLWESNAERDVLDAEHHAYRRLASPVTHRRVVTLDKLKGYWTIKDVFTGKGNHRFEFFFNCDTGLEVSLDRSSHAIVRGEHAVLKIVPVSDCKLESTIEPRWISKAYGTRQNSSAIIYSLVADVPLEVSFQLLVSSE